MNTTSPGLPTLPPLSSDPATAIAQVQQSVVSWEENPQYLSQAGHFLGGASIILTAAMFSIALDAGWNPILITFGAGTTVAAFKEFVLDLRKPENDTMPDSLMDFSFYMLGGAVGLGLAALAMSYAGGGSRENPIGELPKLTEAQVRAIKMARNNNNGHVYAGCPDCGSTDVVRGSGNDPTLVCPACGQQWDPNDAFSEPDPMRWLKRITQ
jgi:hypothetical protein